MLPLQFSTREILLFTTFEFSCAVGVKIRSTAINKIINFETFVLLLFFLRLNILSQFVSFSAVCQSLSWEVGDYFVVLMIMMIYDDGNDLHDLVCDDYEYDHDTIGDLILCQCF